MYKGFKTYRHFLNAKLHALSFVISGSTQVIDEELQERGLHSTTELSDKEAELLYRKFAEVAKNVGSRKKAAEPSSTEKQRKAIIKLYKYVLHWTQEGAFSYLLDTCPAYRKRLNSFEITNSKIYTLLNMLTVKDASKIIKRLKAIIAENNSGGVL